MSSTDDNPLHDIEPRLDKYDAIIARLDVLVEVLTRRVESVATRVEQAIDGQDIILEKVENMHRYSAIAWSITGSGAVGTVMFIVGYLVHR